MAARKGRATPSGGPGGGGVSTVEAEIERSREEGNWKRVIQLAEQLRLRPERTFETLAHFLIGEAKLEDFLEEYPPKEKNAHRAKDGLQGLVHQSSASVLIDSITFLEFICSRIHPRKMFFLQES